MSNTSTTAPKPLSDSVPVISQDIISQDPMSDDVRALSLTEAIEPSQQSVKDNVYSSNTNCDTNSIILSFVGDCTIGTDELFKWNTFDDIYEKEGDPKYFFKEVKSLFENDDFTFVNLEGTFTNATEKAEKEYRYRGKPTYCEILTYPNYKH